MKEFFKKQLRTERQGAPHDHLSAICEQVRSEIEVHLDHPADSALSDEQFMLVSARPDRRGGLRMTSETPAEHPPRLRRVLGLWDLVLYGIVVIQPTAPMPVFGVVSERAQGHVATAVASDGRLRGTCSQRGHLSPAVF